MSSGGDAGSRAGEAVPEVAPFAWPEVRAVPLNAPFYWLGRGFDDLLREPAMSLFYGVVLAVMGYALTTWFGGAAGLAMTTGFLLVGPFLAVGLYEISRKREAGENPLSLDSKEPTVPLEDYMYTQNRFRQLQRGNPERAAMLLEAAKKDVAQRFKMYQQWASLDL